MADTPPPATDALTAVEAAALDEEQLRLKKLEMELNEKLDREILKDPSKMPKAIYFIVPSEFGERFCYYGLNPLLNNFFKSYLGLGAKQALELKHAFTSLAYFAPLLGAAVSDSVLGKYETIVYLSIVYVIGLALTALFAAPGILGAPPNIPLWGPLLGLILVALGTGGIKPCVSSHGGDQFLDIQTTGLNKFYNYFSAKLFIFNTYLNPRFLDGTDMAINMGALIGGFVAPIIAERACFGNDNDCYTWAIAMCGIVMVVATIVFIIGKKWYRIVPAAGVFIPWKIIQVIGTALSGYIKASPEERKQAKSWLSFAEGKFPASLIDEVRDVNTMFLVLLPAPFFWMAFDQNGTTWQNQYAQMNWKWGPVTFSDQMSSNLNPVFIIALVPVFSHFVYPFVEKRFGEFKLLDRMLVGMFLAGISFVIVGIFQTVIDSNLDVLEWDAKAELYICNQDKNPERCMHGAWQIIPYFVLTCGEILFSISGLNFTYNEVGKRMKASSASLWLLMVSIGNILAASLGELYSQVGPMKFLFINSGLIFAAMLIYLWARTFYVYRDDREAVVAVAVEPEFVGDKDGFKKAS
ncbi:hypothetical protein HK102_000674 [Quaeritorhiza haematococci]|nr:hypothetical protein HK102_000674 [Quaeritorhiza haematococci]